MLGKIRPEVTDTFISAELPNPDVDKELFEVVSKKMIHGPCSLLNPNSPCMKDEMCNKKYLRKLQTDSVTDQDGYSFYRHRSPEHGRHTAKIEVRH